MDTPADRLRKARIARGLETARAAARHFGWSDVTYTSHENGTRGLRIDAAKRYAKAFRIPLGELLGAGVGGSVPASNIPVVGSAAWGVWLDMAVMEAPQELATIPIVQDDTVPRRAVKVADNSVDKQIPPGYWAVYIEIDQERIADLPIGALVLIKRRQSNLIERTIRRVQRHTAGKVYLAPHSNDPRYTGVLQISHDTVSDGAAIVGQVVGIYGEFS